MAPGNNLKERIDNWNKNNQLASNVVSTNFFETYENPVPSQFIWIEEEVETVDEPQIQSQQEVEDIRMLENLVVTTQKKIHETKKRNVQKEIGPNKQATVVKERAKNQEPVVIEPSKVPQYKYSTPIEDELVVKKIVQQALDTTLTLTT
jgi:hypothetical protein